MRLVLLSLCVAGLSACAGPPPRALASGLPDFEQFTLADADHSGKWDAQEAKAWPDVSASFERVDLDGDGFVAWNELRRAAGAMLDARRMPPPTSSR